MTPNEYQEKAHAFATKGGDTMAYAVCGFIEELGELCGKIKFANEDVSKVVGAMEVLGSSAGILAKHIRKNWDEMDKSHQQAMKEYAVADGFSKELGDCAWMHANVALHYGKNLDDVLSENIAKLTDRQNRNVIIGNGDNR